MRAALATPNELAQLRMYHMAELRIPIILNKGRKGIPLQKLARISYELQQFLSLLGEDLHIEMGAGWLGTDEIRLNFDRFVGCAPGILGDQGLQDFIDYVRGVPAKPRVYTDVCCSPIHRQE